MQSHSIRFRIPRATAKPLRVSSCLLAVCLAIPALAPDCAAQTAEIDTQRAVSQADRFLRTEARGRETLGFVHFGADYHGHEYLRTVDVPGGDGRAIPGQFALVYRFHWEKDGITDVAYLCNESGRVYGVQIVDTNAVWSKPFVLANATIKLLGNALLERNKNRMNDFEWRMVQKLVDSANAKGLLEWALKFEQPF
jgi:hypothetical protein